MTFIYFRSHEQQDNNKMCSLLNQVLQNSKQVLQNQKTLEMRVNALDSKMDRKFEAINIKHVVGGHAPPDVMDPPANSEEELTELLRHPNIVIVIIVTLIVIL